MAEHSYHQYCPVAHALDLVGDRWSLLILRNLLVGPKRFVDLQTGLPGIGTNILTVRLKGLEQSGVVQRRFLPPPAASMVYELTEYGHQIEGPLTALAHWGAQSLGPLTSEQVIKPDAVIMAIHGWFRGEKRHYKKATYEIRSEDERFHDVFSVHVNGDMVEVAQGSVATPDVVIHLKVETLYALSARQVSLSASLARSDVFFEGEPQAIMPLINQMDAGVDV
jgi:DNA-binding HxlR family transcriptional regulator